MTHGPRRLKDDPDFRWETGCNLADEEDRVGSYDLDGLRSKIVAAALAAPGPSIGDGAPGVRPSPRGWQLAWKPAAGILAGAAAVATAYWLGIQTGQRQSEQERPVQAPAPIVAPAPAPAAIESTTPSPAAPQGTAAEDTPRSAPASNGAQTSSPSRPTASPHAATEAPAAGTPDVAAPALPATAPAAGSADADPSEGRAGTGDASSLAQYRQAYEDADQALSEGRFAQARAGFRSVLDRWPNQYLAVEAQMKLLQCDFGLGDAAATLAQAEAIQDLPAFAARRSEILRLRAESLVRLDRCEEAVSVAEQIGARDAAEIRRGCRAGRKEP